MIQSGALYDNSVTVVHYSVTVAFQIAEIWPTYFPSLKQAVITAYTDARRYLIGNVRP